MADFTKIPSLSPIATLAAALRGGAGTQAELVGPWGSAKGLAAVQTAQALAVPLLIVAPGRTEAEGIYEDLATFAGEDRALLLPAWETLPSDAMDPADDIVAERIETLRRLAAAMERESPAYVVVPVRALLQRVVRRKALMGQALSLKVGEEYDLDELLEKLVKLGYERDVMVEQRGTMSVRGGLFDIFPISTELPFRIEFFGDEIETIRRFEPETQRSVGKVESIEILPRSEKTMLRLAAGKGDDLASILDYFPKHTLIALDEPAAIAEEAERLTQEFADSPYFQPWDEAHARFAKYPRLDLVQIAAARRKDVARALLPTQSISGWVGHLGDFWEQLKRWDADGYRVRLLCVNAGEQRRLHELLSEQGYRLGEDRFDLQVSIGRLRAGFAAPDEKLAVLSEKEMFGRHFVRRSRRRYEAGAAITQFSDLKSGDYVVHAQHGIGRYQGLRRFEGRAGDFLAIQYFGNDVLYVPVTAIDQVQRYVGGDGAVPRVDRLGGATWQKKKAKVKEAIKEMTEELIRIYAAREEGNGHAFSPDTPWQEEFEDAFPYDETPDQLRAIKDVKRDMESDKPMDRLICGDVGYGKTEVALRAAFKAVQDHMQVAVLAPTTVLVQQHFTTFTERMAGYPITIEQVSRFHSAKENKDVIERLKSGEVDIVIGTHRLISKDVRFKNLGLVVIDEEQRFGVGHKEKLKKLRAHVDMLTMSATPIPRTLNFSLMGIRDMSLINTAPNDRLPVNTCIEVWDEAIIQEAITRELAREGQVFFLHNRVQTIEKVASMIHKLVPRARVRVGHGQMERHQLEDVMSAFIRHEFDVLVCTTIIGSGIDIPNANTIIIDRADTFGLAELYQIRGRVGRYKHRAFAYLLIPGDRAVSEEAELRLKSLQEFSHLGSGFRIAMRDLEIRGAGDLLGGEQSGHIITVGYETYKDLIAEAVREARHEPPRRTALPPFEVAIDAHIPEEYVAVPQQKITLYRRIAGVLSVEELDEIAAEIEDRFGRPPGPVRRLLELMRARALAAEYGVRKLAASGGRLEVEFDSPAQLPQRAASRLQQRYGGQLELSWAKRPGLRVTLGETQPVPAALELLQHLGHALGEE